MCSIFIPSVARATGTVGVGCVLHPKIIVCCMSFCHSFEKAGVELGILTSAPRDVEARRFEALKRGIGLGILTSAPRGAEARRLAREQTRIACLFAPAKHSILKGFYDQNTGANRRGHTHGNTILLVPLQSDLTPTAISSRRASNIITYLQ